MPTIYKMTTKTMTTHNDTEWAIGEWMETSGAGELCSEGWLHAYTDPLLAVFLNSIHANIQNPRLFRGLGDGLFKDDSGLKVGYNRMVILEEMVLPSVTLINRVSFGILCAKSVTADKKWNQWADNWLSGKNRTKAAMDTAWAAWAAAEEYAAMDAAEYAAAEDSASSARYAAEAAKYAVRSSIIDLIAIANTAMTYK